jgi:hypothetical protein
VGRGSVWAGHGEVVTVQIPELIETNMVARVIGWTTRKTTKFLLQTGMAFRPDGWRDAMVVRETLEAQMPSIYKLFVQKYTAGELLSKRGRRPIRR